MPVIETKPNIGEGQIFQSWIAKETGDSRQFSEDSVIDAYLSGKRDGAQQANNLMIKQFSDNMMASANHTAKVLDLLKSKKLTPKTVHLRPNSFDRFEVLITLNETDFLSEVFFEGLLNEIAKIERDVAEEFYNISFNFINRSEHFDDDLLISDGYRFRHASYN